MEKPKSPYQEITTEENLDIHGNLRFGTWKGVQTLRARAAFFKGLNNKQDPEAEAPEFVSGPFLDDFCDRLIRTTGSIDGKHRESTTQAVQGQKAPTIALGVPAAPQPNGHIKGPVGLS